MRLFYWLHLIGFISLLSFLGLLKNLAERYLNVWHQTKPSIDTVSSPHPFLSGQKLKITQATVAEISSIDGISIKGARVIAQFFHDHPHAQLKDALILKGVGPKTLERLGELFF